jgi:hypothetical protein
MAMASPRPVPVVSATQKAGLRCPCRRHCPESAARQATRVLAATIVRSMAVKTSKSFAASPVVTRFGLEIGELPLDLCEYPLEGRQLNGDRLT